MQLLCDRPRMRIVSPDTLYCLPKIWLYLSLQNGLIDANVFAGDAESIVRCVPCKQGQVLFVSCLPCLLLSLLFPLFHQAVAQKLLSRESPGFESLYYSPALI